MPRMAKKTEAAPRDAAAKDVLGMEGGDPTVTNGEARAEAPICPYCAEQCKPEKPGPIATRFVCPKAGCGYAVKVPRPDWQARLSRQRTRDANAAGFAARD
jgi:hypothetical protein